MVDFQLSQYTSDLSVVYRLFRKYQPQAALIGVTTTARRIANQTTELDSLNSQVIGRNTAVKAFFNDKQIPVVDLYAISLKNPEYYENDGIHFNQEGIAEEAKEVGMIVLSSIQAIKR